MVQQHGNGNGNADYLPTFLERYDDLTRIANDAEFTRVKAFVDTMAEYGRNELGELDYKKLDDPEFGQRVAISMGARMRNAAKDAVGARDGLPWYRLDALSNAITGLTGGAIKQIIDQEKSDLTLQRLVGMSEELNKPLFQVLSPSTWMHIPNTQAARATVIGELGLAGKLNPAQARIDEIVQLMIHYHQTRGHHGEGVVLPRMYERSPAYIPPGNHGGH